MGDQYIITDKKLKNSEIYIVNISSGCMKKISEDNLVKILYISTPPIFSYRK